MENKKIENKDIYDKISRNIKKYRKIKKMTQSELAEKAEVSHEFIRRIESSKGKKSFSIVTLERIANALNINIKYLFEVEKDK